MKSFVARVIVFVVMLLATLSLVGCGGSEEPRPPDCENAAAAAAFGACVAVCKPHPGGGCQ